MATKFGTPQASLPVPCLPPRPVAIVQQVLLVHTRILQRISAMYNAFTRTTNLLPVPGYSPFDGLAR